MAGVVDLLHVALGEVGTMEQPAGSNRQKYGQAYGWDGVAWCAQFVWWCLRQSGNDGLALKTASVPALLGWARSRSIVDLAPTVGALACYDWAGDGVPDHVGIVLEVTGPHAFDAVEGNTSSDDRGSQSNGGGVFVRHRVTQQVAGFVHLPYPPGADMPIDLTPASVDAVARRTVELLTGASAVQQVHVPGSAALEPITDALTAILGAVTRGTPVVLSEAQMAALGAAVAAHLPPGPAPDPHAFAVASADELARRLTS